MRLHFTAMQMLYDQMNSINTARTEVARLEADYKRLMIALGVPIGAMIQEDGTVTNQDGTPVKPDYGQNRPKPLTKEQLEQIREEVEARTQETWVPETPHPADNGVKPHA